MLNPEKAAEVIERMALLKFFPTTKGAVSQLIEILCEICRNGREADLLLGVMLEQHSEWPGPAALRDIQRSLQAKDKEWKGLGERPEISCTRCNDFGHVGGVRCICAAGAALPDEFLLAFKALEKRSHVITGPERKKTIAEDTARVNRSLMEY